MREWIFTFGYGHTHPKTGQSLAKKFVRIHAPNGDRARDLMFQQFGRTWAMQYESEAQAGVEKYGLTEVK